MLTQVPGDGQRPAVYWSPQHFGLWPHLTAREHLAAVAADPAAVDATLRDFDLTDRADARPGELSKGQASRLSIARALLTGASVLLFDEPLTAVDAARALARRDGAA